ncbi:hypothetical protein EJ08DRAFT_13787 [Tothia fuscella]|uniref:Uncharacterized protein n=1 Tax=Tothia fuscella TaxID=1048955 RepID=A0A9P4U3Q6_9PEZI|nr:hypothetical protein EJ08DRAFT_13787 [Tothia fuscella]
MSNASSSVIDPEPFPLYTAYPSRKPATQWEPSRNQFTAPPKRSVHFADTVLTPPPPIYNYNSNPRVNYMRAENMPHRTDSVASSGAIDDEGYYGPGVRSIGARTMGSHSQKSATPSYHRYPTGQPSSARAPSPVRYAAPPSRRASYRVPNDDDDSGRDPYNFPKLPKLNSRQNSMRNSYSEKQKPPITRNQRKSLGSFVAATYPSSKAIGKENTRRQSKPATYVPQNHDAPPSRKGSTRDPPPPNNEVAAEVKQISTDLRRVSALVEQQRKESKALLEQQRKESKAQLEQQRRESQAQLRAMSKAKIPERIVEEEESDVSEHIPAPKSPKKGKQAKKTNNNPNNQKQKAPQQKPPSKPLVEPEFSGYRDSGSKKDLPKGLQQHSPDYSQKFDKWDVLPGVSPPSVANFPPSNGSSKSSSNKPPSQGAGWGDTGNTNQGWGASNGKEGSSRSKGNENEASWRATAPNEQDHGEPRRSKSSGDHSRSRSHHTDHHYGSQAVPSVAAGTVIWGAPTPGGGIEAGTEQWGDGAGLGIIAASHRTSSRHTASLGDEPSHRRTSQRETSRHEIPRQSSAEKVANHASWAHNSQDGGEHRRDTRALDPIPEYQPMRSHHSGSRRSSKHVDTTEWKNPDPRRESRSGSRQQHSPTKSEYRTPAVEDDPTNWSGWQKPDWQGPSHRDDRTPSMSSRDRSPKATSASRVSENRSSSKRNDIIDSWMTGRTPSEESRRTGYEPREESGKGSRDGQGGWGADERSKRGSNHGSGGWSRSNHGSGGWGGDEVTPTRPKASSGGSRSRSGEKQYSNDGNWDNADTGGRGFF